MAGHLIVTKLLAQMLDGSTFCQRLYLFDLCVQCIQLGLKNIGLAAGKILSILRHAGHQRSLQQIGRGNIQVHQRIPILFPHGIPLMLPLMHLQVILVHQIQRSALGLIQQRIFKQQFIAEIFDHIVIFTVCNVEHVSMPGAYVADRPDKHILSSLLFMPGFHQTQRIQILHGLVEQGAAGLLHQTGQRIQCGLLQKHRFNLIQLINSFILLVRKLVDGIQYLLRFIFRCAEDQAQELIGCPIADLCAGLVGQRF